jgi:YegS/Rv2252/BmrU family lipid kinase
MKDKIDNSLNFQFIVNPLAGHGKYRKTINSIQKALSDSGLKYDIEVPQHSEETISIAKKAAENHDVVVAAGGDGTINAVLNGIIGTQAMLGIIPIGTGNGIAREFDLPSDPEEIYQILTSGHTRSVDVGEVNGRYFLGTAGLGFDALISKFTQTKRGPLRGMWLYFFAGFVMFLNYTPKEVNLKINGKSINVIPLIITIANVKRYGGRALVAPDAKPDDGLFDVCIIREMSALRLLLNISKLFNGNHIYMPEVAIYRGNEVSISVSDIVVPIHVDGESIGSYSQLDFSLVPKAVKVLVPKILENEGD